MPLHQSFFKNGFWIMFVSGGVGGGGSVRDPSMFISFSILPKPNIQRRSIEGKCFGHVFFICCTNSPGDLWAHALAYRCLSVLMRDKEITQSFLSTRTRVQNLSESIRISFLFFQTENKKVLISLRTLYLGGRSSNRISHEAFIM